MMRDLFEFNSKIERIIFIVILIILLLSVVGMAYVYVNPNSFTQRHMFVITSYDMGKANSQSGNQGLTDDSVMGASEVPVSLELSSFNSKQDYYDLFLCPCCGNSIASNCCGMAKERMKTVDKLYDQGYRGEELVVEMVKKYGFESLISDEVKAMIKDNPAFEVDENSPMISLNNDLVDLGVIKQSEGNVSARFVIENVGASDLVITGMDTSCMCTTASITYDGVEGPVFGMSMHGGNPNDWNITIPPGDKAVLNVYYNPMAHGIQKENELRIIREVTIMSNDPINFRKKVRIQLTQLK